MKHLNRLPLIAAISLLPASAFAQQPSTASAEQTGNRIREALLNERFEVRRLGQAEAADLFDRADMARAPATFLGVLAEAAPESLSAQLKLPNGTGLVVRDIVPEGPAEQAGLQKHDVMLKLNDQLLINSNQLAVLVRTFEPGARVTLEVIRGGSRHTLTATLIEKNLPPLQAMSLQNGPEGRTLTLSPGPHVVTPGFEVRDPQGVMIIRRPAAGQAERTVTSSSPHGEVTLRTAGQEKHLTITGADGAVSFDGPVSTDAQVKALPADVHEKFDSAMKMLTEAESKRLNPPTAPTPPQGENPQADQ